MFQLIVAVISIALVAVLAIASTYYGGTAFTQSQQKAQITALVNAGEQIAGANALYVTDWGQNALTVAANAPSTDPNVSMSMNSSNG